PEGLTAIRQIARELENCRAALRWADAHPEEARDAALGFALMRQGIRRADWDQDGRWLSALRVEPGSGAGRRGPASVPVANLLFSLGGLISDFGDPEEATAEVAELVRLVGGRAPWSLLCMGYLTFERSVPESRRHTEKALALMREDGT